jgi:hypothetical protein
MLPRRKGGARSSYLAEPPLQHWHGHPPGASGAVGRMLHAGMDREGIDQAGDGKEPHHPGLRRGEQQVTADVPSLLPNEHQRRHAAGVDELQPGQIHDDHRLAGRNLCERSRETRGVQYVKLAAQRDDNLAVDSLVLRLALNMGPPSCFSSKAGS